MGIGGGLCLSEFVPEEGGGGEVQSGSKGSEGKTLKGPEKEGAGCNDAREGERNLMQEDGGRVGGGSLKKCLELQHGGYYEKYIITPPPHSVAP